ncbi:MAG: hypothetical protein LAP85_26035 [Acidobacteriia bacterium]|nr:hypothetical protein [Terriglobia bacterium]
MEATTVLRNGKYTFAPELQALSRRRESLQRKKVGGHGRFPSYNADSWPAFAVDQSVEFFLIPLLNHELELPQRLDDGGFHADLSPGNADFPKEGLGPHPQSPQGFGIGNILIGLFRLRVEGGDELILEFPPSATRGR